MGDMTPTDEQHGQLDTGYPHTLRPELHKALMARGIDYWVTQGITFWNRDDGCECLAYGYKANGVPKLAIKVVGFTEPEQAIAATLGTGMCHDVCSGLSEFTCSACGFNCDLTSWISLFDGDEGRHRHHHHGMPNYCPNCGRRVVSE